jgi:hypothetical protein
MSIPTVDTFEHDIAEEIRTKEASITDIASAGGDIGNTAGKGPQTSNMLVIIGILFIVLVIGACIAFFFFYKKESSIPPLTATSTPSSSNQLASISSALQNAVGPDIGTVSRSSYGYSMQLVSYSPVFAYMTRNESAFADELAYAVGSPRDTSTTTVPFSFTDLTLSNQNMRVGTSGSSTIIYAFVNAQTLLVSSSTQGILSLRSGILK